MALTALSLIVIRSADIEASLAFYRALGIVFVQEQHGSGPIHYSCDFGGLVLELYPEKTGSVGESRAPSTMLGFNVTSLEEALAELHKLGIKPNSQPRQSAWGCWVNVIDPGGYTVQLNQIGTQPSAG